MKIQIWKTRASSEQIKNDPIYIPSGAHGDFRILHFWVRGKCYKNAFF